MALNINNDALAKLETAFNYAQQAARTERTGNDSVIRINGEDFSCSVSHADAPKSGFGLLRFRGKDQQALNNATRALFKQTVFDALGVKSEDELPRSVKNAMELSNYHNKGRPLTARRIMAVVNAIRTAMPEAAVGAAINNCLERNAALCAAKPDIPKLEVTPKMRTQVTALVAQHGKGLTPKALQVLANYAIFTLANEYAAPNADRIIGMLAESIAKFDDFEYGDERFAPLNNKLTEVYQDKFDFYMAPEHADGEFNNNQNVCDTMLKDAYRAGFEINGSNPKAGIVEKEEMKKAVVGKFKQEVPEKFQKPLSLFMCQTMGRIVGEMLAKRLSMMSTDEPVEGADYKGGELMPFSPMDGECFNSMSGIAGGGKNLRYKLQVNEDKKSATVTFESDYDLVFRIEDAGYDGENICGGVKYSEQFKFDLSGETLKMTSHLTSQHIEP